MAQPHIPALHPYVPGTQPTEEGWIKLNTNELPYPPSPRVLDAITAASPTLRRYPSPTSASLRSALAEHHGLVADNVVVGNGSDDILNLLVRVFAGPSAPPIGQTFPSYSLYPILAAIADSGVCNVAFGGDMQLPLEAIAQLNARILFFTTPNAPTGVGFTKAEVASVVEAFPGIVVADEAYADFAAEDAVALVRDHPRLVVTRTLSKSYGLAGLRVGYALAHPEVIGLLDRVRDSYNVNALSQAGALAALDDQAHLKASVAKVLATRERVFKALTERDWFTYPSTTNFLLTRPQTAEGESGPEVAADLFAFLKQRKILVRYFPKGDLTADKLRVSIGTDAQLDALLEAFDAWQTTVSPA